MVLKPSQLSLLPQEPADPDHVGLAMLVPIIQFSGMAGVRPLMRPLIQDNAAIAFGTGEPLGGQLIVWGDQVTLVDQAGSTLARFKFTGRNIQELVQGVLDSDVQPPNEEAIAMACLGGAETIANVNLFSVLWDSSQSSTLSGQTTDGEAIVSFAAFKNEAYDCQTNEYTSSFMVIYSDSSTGLTGIAAESNPSLLRPAPTPTPTPTTTPTQTPPPTATPVPTNVPTATPVPEPVEASLTSISCTGRELLYAGQYIYSDYIVTGTVSGPVGTTLSGTLTSTSSWTKMGAADSWERGPNDPATTEWQVQSAAGALGGSTLYFSIWAVYPPNGSDIFNWTESCPN